MPKSLSAVIIVLLIALVGGVGFLWWNSEVRFAELLEKIDMASEATSAPAPAAAEPEEVGRISYSSGSAVVYLCEGEVRQAVMEDADTRYCVGDHTLVLRRIGQDDVLLTAGSARRDVDAPFLLKVESLNPARGPARLVISFASQGCMVDDSLCGVGMPENYVTGTYDFETARYTALNNFPDFGTPIWSPDGRQVLSYPHSCGGAGCMAEPITVYDLTTDSFKGITEEKAADQPGAQDVSGQRLPFWKDLHWSGPGEFTVTLVEPSGREREIGGSTY